ncbi:MAG: hypothetical protein DI536_35635, partial [Archangium gephyra]
MAPYSVTVSGVSASLSGATFTATVPLTEGTNELTAQATDAVSATANASITVQRDGTAPLITVTQPLDNPHTTSQAVVTIEGNVYDSNLAEVRVAGALVNTVAGHFITDITLTRGRTDLVIEALDTLGNRSQYVQRFDAPMLAPAVVILEPRDFATSDVAWVHVRARVNATAAVSEVRIGASPVTINATGDYEADIALALGENVIPVVATDASGAQGAAQVRVRYRDASTEPLEVTSVSPANQATDVETDSRVTISFNKPIQPANFSTQFVVRAAGISLPGSYYLAPGQQALSFSAEKALPENAALSVEVENISPQAGPGLSAPFRSTFSTRRALTQVHGVVLDDAAIPVKDARVDIRDLGLTTRTDNDGNYHFFVPGAGSWKVTVSQGLSAEGRALPTISRRIAAVDGKRTDDTTLFLVPTDGSSRVSLNNDGQPVQSGEVTLTLPPGSFHFENGLTGAVTLTAVPPPLKGPPVADIFGPEKLWQLQPAGTSLTAPIDVSFAVTNQVPGRFALLFGYSTTTMTIARTGLARVSTDGQHLDSLAPFHPESIEWLGYKILSEEASNAVSAALASIPDGGGAQLRMPERGPVDWFRQLLLPSTAWAQGLAAFFAGALTAGDTVMLAAQPSYVTGKVRGPRGTLLEVTLETPTGFTVPRAGTLDGGIVSVPVDTLVETSTPGTWQLPFHVRAYRSPPAPGELVDARITALRDDNTAATAPSGGSWHWNSERIDAASTVDVRAGVTTLTLEVVGDFGRRWRVSHRIHLYTDAQGQPLLLQVREAENTLPVPLDHAVYYSGVRVTLTGPGTDKGGTTGATGGFGIPTLVSGGDKGLVCADIAAGETNQALPSNNGVTTYRRVENKYSACSQPFDLAFGSVAVADVLVDARMLYGDLSFVGNDGVPLPVRYDDSLNWSEGDGGNSDARLTSISAKDIDTTEVSFFRASDLNTPIATLAPARILDASARTGAASASYARLRVGPTAFNKVPQRVECARINAILAASRSTADAAFYASFCTPAVATSLSPGETLVVVAVNYRTGYAGMRRVRVPPISALQLDANDQCAADIAANGELPQVDGPNGPIAYSRCLRQSLGIKADIVLYPPQIETRISRTYTPVGVPQRDVTSLVRNGGAATTADKKLAISTRWRVKLPPADWLSCVENQGTNCDVELEEDDSLNAGGFIVDGGVSSQHDGTYALVDVGQQGRVLEVPCTDLDPRAPQKVTDVCAAAANRLDDIPGGVAPLYGQFITWNDTALALSDSPISTFRVPPGANTLLVDTATRTRTQNGVELTPNLNQALHFIHIVGQSQYDSPARSTGENEPPPPFANLENEPGPRADTPLRAVALKAVYSSFDEGSVPVLRYDSSRGHQFRVLGLTQTSATAHGSGAPRDVTVADADAEVSDNEYRFFTALESGVPAPTAPGAPSQFRLRVGSDAVGQECTVTYDAATNSIIGQCDADALEDVLSANDIVYLSLYLSGNAENVLWRTNFWGLTRRTDILSSQSRYTYEDATRPTAENAISRQANLPPCAMFSVSQRELPPGKLGTVVLCKRKNDICPEDDQLAKGTFENVGGVIRVVSQLKGEIGRSRRQSADGSFSFYANLPSYYADMESNLGATSTKQVHRGLVEIIATPPSWVTLGTPRARAEAHDSYVWAQPEAGPVSVVTGRLAFSHTDLSLPLAPSSLTFTRHYNNQNNLVGSLGIGWRHAYEGVIVMESARRFVAVIGLQAWQFTNCNFEASTSSCTNDGTHGSTLQRFKDANGNLAFVLTDVSGQRFLFRHTVGDVAQPDGPRGDGHYLLVDGGVGQLQLRWFLSAVDEGPAATPGDWFAATLPENWWAISYDGPTTNVAAVRRNGAGIGLTFEYEDLPAGDIAQVRTAARQWGMRRLRAVRAINSADEVYAAVSYGYNDARHQLRSATLEVLSSSSPFQEWRYGYAPPDGAGLTDVDTSNEIDTVDLALAPPDGGALQVQQHQAYSRANALVPGMQQVARGEVVTGFTLPGQSGVPTTVSFPSAEARQVTSPEGVVTNFTLSAYGAADVTQTGTHRSESTWASQQSAPTVIPLTPFRDAEGVQQKPDLDSRLRSNGTFLTPSYARADEALDDLAPGNTYTVTERDARFAHAATVTLANGTKAITTINTSGDVTSQTVQRLNDIFEIFTAPAYDAQHRLTSWVDAQGRTVTVTQTHPFFGLPEVMTITAGATVVTRSMTWDALGRLTRTTDDGDGSDVETTFDALGRPTYRRVLGSAPAVPDEVTTWDYMLEDKKLTVVERCAAVGAEVRTVVEDGLLTEKQWRFGANATLVGETFTYDGGLLASRRDARGVTHEYVYDSAGLLRLETAGGITVQSIERDNDGRPLAVTDSARITTAVIRDSKGQAAGSQDGTPGGEAVKTKTDLSGSVTGTLSGSREYSVVSSPFSSRVSFASDVDAGQTLDTEETFDAAGRVASRIDRVSGVQETFVYADLRGRLTTYTRSFPTPAGLQSLTEQRAYVDDPTRRTTTVTTTRTISTPLSPTPRIETSTQVFSVRGLLISATEEVTQLDAPAETATTSFTYDAKGRL